LAVARILIVDDEPHIVKLICFSLEKAGHETVAVTDGISAISAARDEAPDLILMDVMMPVMTGYETVERLKAEPATADIPVIMLSAKSQLYEREKGIDCGAVCYICKPFTPRELVEQVSRFLDGP